MFGFEIRNTSTERDWYNVLLNQMLYHHIAKIDYQPQP